MKSTLFKVFIIFRADGSPGLGTEKAKMSDNPSTPTAPTGIFEKISSTIHDAEEGVVHTVQGVAEGLKHGTSQILHGGKEELSDFAKGVRESNEALPSSKHGTGAMSGASRNLGRVAERTRGTIEKHGHPRSSPEYNRLAGVVETGQGDVLTPDELEMATRGTMGNIANDEARSAWTQSHVYGQKAREPAGKIAQPIAEKLGQVKVEESPLERLTQPISGRLEEAVEKIKGGIETMRQGATLNAKETAASTAERGKELAGDVAKEVGHATGAAKAMDPSQLPVRHDLPKGKSLAESVQREYQAGQQEQMVNESVASDSVPRNFTEEVEGVAGKVKEQTQGVAEGVARQYGKATETLKKKVDEGAAQVRH